MASETLSQQEIDLLFGGAGQNFQPRKPSTADVQVYDFRRPNRISKDRMRALEAMYGILVKSLENWLTSRVRTQVELQLLAVEQLSFGEFLLSLTTPCASYVFDIADSGGAQGVIDFGTEFSFFLIDRLLGGTGAPGVMDRALTPLERLIVRLVAEQTAAQLSEVWQDHVKLDLKLSRFESIPDMLQIANREDPVLVANVEVMAGGIRSQLLMCLPFSVLETFFTTSGPQRIQRAQLSSDELAADRKNAEWLLRMTRVEVSARLPRFRLSMRHLMALRPGSVVATGLAPDSPVELIIEGRLRFRGRTGKIGRKLAVRIEEELAREPVPGETNPEAGRNP